MSEGDALTEAVLDMTNWIKKSENEENAYLRVIVTDNKGYYAVTRAYFKDELEDK